MFPYNSSAKDILDWKPDGFMISNGPGDPASMKEAIATVKEVVDSGVPTFGICLGHQLLSLASGLETYKMHHGHRGINHPVKNLITGKCEVTSQNHAKFFNYTHLPVSLLALFIDCALSKISLMRLTYFQHVLIGNWW